MKYTVTGRNNRQFELFDEQGKACGRVEHVSLLNARTQLTTANGTVYDIQKHGMLRWEMIIRRKGAPVAKIKYSIAEGMPIKFSNGETYTLKRRTMLGGSYVLVDDQQQEIASMERSFNWRSMSFMYELDLHGVIDDAEIGAVLPGIVVYCDSYARMRHAAAA